ncbi:MAG TPA: histidine kinase dimerization/phospho-acceptor domain-containing protein, partial [Chitinophagaceae bacterium]|nr:histidine kinase dimerization/phospho-acceptor domain-containing protein [Chitinophagaceae bacterium]
MKPHWKNILFSKYGLLLAGIALFTFSLVFNKLYTNRTSVARELRLAENYIAHHQQDFNRLLKDSTLMRRLVQRKESLPEFESLANRKYGIFVYTADELGKVYMQFWSDQVAVPPPELFAMEDGESFHKLANGYYVAVKKTMTLQDLADNVITIALIPIRSEYFIETDYLPLEFFFSETAEKRVVISNRASEYPVHSLSGKTLFYFEKKMAGALPFNDNLTIILRLGAIVFLFLFLHLYAESLNRRKGPWIAISVLAGSLIFIRVIIYLYPSLLNLRQFELFDPTIYGSNAVQRSLGDLLINAILFSWIILFAWSKFQHLGKPAGRFSKPWKWVIGGISLCMLIYSTFVVSSVIRSMVADSKIPFDVVDFSSLNQYTVFGFVVLALLSLSYYYFSQLLFRLIFPMFRERRLIIYFVIGLVGLIYLTVRSGDPAVVFYIPVLLWLLLYTWLVNRKGLIFSHIRINIAGILFWIFVFSVSIAAIMLVENKEAEWARRTNFAEKMAMQADPSSERLLNIALRYLDNDFLSDNFSRFYDPVLSKKIRDSILAQNYRGYLNKYDTRFYLYDAKGRSINNEDRVPYDDLNTLLQVQAQPATTEGISFYESSFDKFIYITRRNIFDTAGKQMGSLFILSNPKRFSSEAIYPELFKQGRKTDPESSPIYAYAVYKDLRLVSPSNKYPFPTDITENDIPKSEIQRRENGDYLELWYRAGIDKVVVLARKKDTIIETITLFSYIFCSFLFLVFIVQLISLLLKILTHRIKLRNILQMNIRTQVHSTIIFISIFSFLIIGISIISFFISRYKRNNTDKLSRTVSIMVNEMQKELADHSSFDDVLKIYDSAANKNLQQLVSEISEIHGVDVNVYDLDGNLHISSDANTYNRGVLSKKMEPTAYYYLSRYRLIQRSQEEKIGTLSYWSIYAPVRDEKLNVYSYVNIPYFTSQSELNQEISNFLVTIINLNAFIFLVAGLIALFITNRITSSFSIISDKMREVNLGKLNEEISWNRDDEIGELVKEYNKMVGKLEESAIALAKSEREGAWREMARQVAHEIKNPLTPMKLSIQYLQKAINNNQPNVKELSGTVANTLVEQIDHLSKIAADFSQFANIGNTNVTRFDLHDVLGSLKELYQTDEKVQFKWRPVKEPVIVEADKTQMNRLFTNLFANAREA